MSTLTLERLRVTTSGGRALVDDVSWTVSGSQRLGIIGASGSGKSMTGRAVMGVLPASLRATGRILLDDVDLLYLPPARMNRVRGSRIAFVPQEPGAALDPLMRVGRQIGGVLRLHGTAPDGDVRAEVHRLLERVRIDDVERVASAYPWQLSGGQRQRVCIAQALACRPDVVIADEPTTALDVTVQAAVLELLDDLVSATGTALVFISHDLPVVAALCPRLVVMDGGHVVEETDTARVRDSDHPYTRTLVEAATGTSPGDTRAGATHQHREDS